MLCVKRKRKQEETDDNAAQNYLVEVRKKVCRKVTQKTSATVGRRRDRKPAVCKTNYQT